MRPLSELELLEAERRARAVRWNRVLVLLAVLLVVVLVLMEPLPAELL